LNFQRRADDQENNQLLFNATVFPIRAVSTGCIEYPALEACFPKH
jgi:hypothetical protein